MDILLKPSVIGTLSSEEILRVFCLNSTTKAICKKDKELQQLFLESLRKDLRMLFIIDKGTDTYITVHFIDLKSQESVAHFGLDYSHIEQELLKKHIGDIEALSLGEKEEIQLKEFTYKHYKGEEEWSSNKERDILFKIKGSLTVGFNIEASILLKLYREAGSCYGRTYLFCKEDGKITQTDHESILDIFGLSFQKVWNSFIASYIS